MRNPRLGDILEIRSKVGLAYAHYVHHHREWNAVLAVFDVVFRKRPEDFTRIASGPVRFFVFFPLRSASRQKAVEVVANAPISESNRRLPRFRGGSLDFRTGRVSRWWIWNGEDWHEPDVPDAELRKLSPHGSVDIEYLEHLIETGYTPETEWDRQHS